jgi:glutaredoxin
MEFEEPMDYGFTIYSKSGCQNCLKVKNLLKEKKMDFNVIDCDDYLIEDKENFLLFINKLTQKDVKIFPMIFYKNEFIGGYNETKDAIDKIAVSFDDNVDF